MSEQGQLKAIQDVIYFTKRERERETERVRAQLLRAEMRNKQLREALKQVIAHGDACHWFAEPADHEIRSMARLVLKFDGD